MAKAKTTREDVADDFDSYSMADHGYRGVSGMRGDHTILPGARVRMVRPKWEKAGPLWFRPLPAVGRCEGKTRVLPVRKSDNMNDMTSWIVRIPAAISYVGVDETFTALLYNPTVGADYNPYKVHPYYIAFYRLRDAFKSGRFTAGNRNRWDPDWNKLMPAARNDGKSRRRSKDDGGDGWKNPTGMGFLQGIVYENAGEVYLGKDKAPLGLSLNEEPCVIQLSSSAVAQITRRFNELKEGLQDLPDDADIFTVNWGARMKYGDPVKTSKGRFIAVFNPDETQMPGYVPSGEKAFGSSYGVMSYQEYKHRGQAYSAQLDGGDEFALKRFRPWSQVLQFPSNDEFCVLMAKAFKSVPKMLEGGWMDNPEFFTDEVRSILYARTSAAVGATPQEEEDEAAPPPRVAQRAGARSRNPLIEDEDAADDPVAEDTDDDDEDEAATEAADEADDDEDATDDEADDEADDDEEASDDDDDDATDDEADDEDDEAADEVDAEDEDDAAADGDADDDEPEAQTRNVIAAANKAGLAGKPGTDKAQAAKLADSLAAAKARAAKRDEAAKPVAAKAAAGKKTGKKSAKPAAR